MGITCPSSVATSLAAIRRCVAACASNGESLSAFPKTAKLTRSAPSRCNFRATTRSCGFRVHCRWDARRIAAYSTGLEVVGICCMHIAYGRILSQRRSTSGRVLAPAVVPGTWTFTWAHGGTDVAALLCGRLTLRAEGESDKTEHDGCAGGGAAFSRQIRQGLLQNSVSARRIFIPYCG